MKNTVIVVIALVVGIGCGWMAHSACHQRSQSGSIENMRPTDYFVLWNQERAERVLHEESVLSSLHSNDYSLARNQLTEDLTKMLSGEGKVVAASFFTTNVVSYDEAFKAAKTSLEQSKR
jgi:hypothetical protein